jgi:hypothetical protein
MVAELTEHIAGWERIAGALNEIRACREDTNKFLDGEFDQLDLLYESFLTRLQSHESVELRQMKEILETMSKQVIETKRHPEPAPLARPPSGIAGVAMSDPVLGSVLAQFELLQQDRFGSRENAK